MSADIELRERVPDDLAFLRLDQVVATMFPQYSRSRLQAWIKGGELLVDGQLRRTRDKLSGGELIEIRATPEAAEDTPEQMALDIVFEDESVIVLNKPAGVIVHPGAGNPTGTLLNGLLYFDPSLDIVPRAGIVHRLDKVTSGLMVVARTLEAQNSLVDQLQSHTVRRIYRALVYGIPPVAGQVDAPISRHPTQRTRMTVMPGGKEAVTHYKRLRQFSHIAHMEFALETGRTHQIRVHMQHLGFPLVGDPVYGGSLRVPAGATADLADALRAFPRQALHAVELAFDHPSTGEEVRFVSPLPEDFRGMLAVLEAADGD